MLPRHADKKLKSVFNSVCVPSPGLPIESPLRILNLLLWCECWKECNFVCATCCGCVLTGKMYPWVKYLGEGVLGFENGCYGFIPLSQDGVAIDGNVCEFRGLFGEAYWLWFGKRYYLFDGVIKRSLHPKELQKFKISSTFQKLFMDIVLWMGASS